MRETMILLVTRSLEDWATLLTIARMRLIESPIDLIEVLGNREGYDEQSVNDYVDGRKVRALMITVEFLRNDPIE